MIEKVFEVLFNAIEIPQEEFRHHLCTELLRKVLEALSDDGAVIVAGDRVAALDEVIEADMRKRYGSTLTNNAVEGAVRERQRFMVEEVISRGSTLVKRDTSISESGCYG